MEVSRKSVTNVFLYMRFNRRLYRGLALASHYRYAVLLLLLFSSPDIPQPPQAWNSHATFLTYTTLMESEPDFIC